MEVGRGLGIFGTITDARAGLLQQQLLKTQSLFTGCLSWGNILMQVMTLS